VDQKGWQSVEGPYEYDQLLGTSTESIQSLTRAFSRGCRAFSTLPCSRA
jgi:hypothetical protein